MTLNKIRKDNWYKNVVVNREDFGKGSVCHICNRDIETPLKVHIEKKKTRNAHLFCQLKQMEQELQAFENRTRYIQVIKEQILKFPEVIEQEKLMFQKQDIIKRLE